MTEYLDDEADELPADALTSLVDDLAHALANIVAPDWYINSDFRVLFSERKSYNHIADCSPLSFAPGLEQVLLSLFLRLWSSSAAYRPP